MRESTINENNYLPNLTILRIVATISVIWLHTCSTLAQNPDLFTMSGYQLKVLNSGYQMMYWAVPVFFMITGSLLLNPQKIISPIDCIRKYAFRVFLALVIFGFPFAILRTVAETGEIGIFLIPQGIISIFENEGLSHLWYLYSLIGVYIILPMLRYFVDKAEETAVLSILIALFIFDFVVPVINNVSGHSIKFTLPLAYPVFYTLIGWYLNRISVNKIRSFSIVIIPIVIFLIWFLNFRTSYSKEMTVYDSPLIAILAMSIFFAFQVQFTIPKDLALKIWNIDRLCFGVYLIHPVFIQFTYRFLRITPLNIGVFPISAVMFAVIFTIISFVCSAVMYQIPMLRKYVL